MRISGNGLRVLVGVIGALLLTGNTMVGQASTHEADKQLVSKKTATGHPDTESVTFEDATLKQCVIKALGGEGHNLTYGDIRSYSGDKTLDLRPANALTSLKGLESLNELPQGVGLSLSFTLKQIMSLAPLVGLRVSGNFTLIADSFHRFDLTPLNQVRFVAGGNGTRSFGLIGLKTDESNYQGLTQADLKLLKPCLAAFAKYPAFPGDDGKLVTRFNFSCEAITDFSVLKSLGPVNVTALGQYQNFVHSNPTTIDLATFKKRTIVKVPTQVKGLDGEPLQTANHVYDYGLKILGHGTDMLLVGPAPADRPKYMVIYGLLNEADRHPATYPDGSILSQNGMEYYGLKWQEPVKRPVPAPKPSVHPKRPSDDGQQATLPKRPVHEETSSAAVSAAGTQQPSDQAPAKPVPTSPTIAKGTVVYATKAIYRYRHATFRTTERLSRYSRQPRVDRPMFVVMGYARSRQGLLRYRVRDVNHDRKTDGAVGYITARSAYVRPIYYQHPARTVKVIAVHGVNAYHQANANQVKHHYRRGMSLHVVGLVHYHLTTRFVLQNGEYVTANRKLVTIP